MLLLKGLDKESIIISLIPPISGFLMVLKIRDKLFKEASFIYSFVSFIIEVNLGTIIGKFSESYFVPQ